MLRVALTIALLLRRSPDRRHRRSPVPCEFAQNTPPPPARFAVAGGRGA